MVYFLLKYKHVCCYLTLHSVHSMLLKTAKQKEEEEVKKKIKKDTKMSEMQKVARMITKSF